MIERLMLGSVIGGRRHGVGNDLKVTVRVYCDMGSRGFSPGRISEVKQMEGLKGNCRSR